MNPSATIRVIAENLTADARATAPGEGRRAAVETNLAGVRTWLEAFAGLSPLEADEAGAQLLLYPPGRQLVVRYAGGRLIREEGGAFTAVTVDEIMANLSAGPATGETAADTEEPAAFSASRKSGQPALLAALLGLVAVAWWWTSRPERPEGIEWVSTAESQVTLGRLSGSYTGAEENLRIDAASATLETTDLSGATLLRSTLRVGRQGGGIVLVLENGVQLEARRSGDLAAGNALYHRSREALKE